MHVSVAQQTRHLLLRFERGDELPEALTRALREASVTTAWIEGAGRFEVVELAGEGGRRIEEPVEVTHLTGRAVAADASSSLRLWATLARADGGTAMAGEIGSARIAALDVHVVALDDAPPAPREERQAPPQQQYQPPQQQQQHQPGSGPQGFQASRTPVGGEMNSAAGPMVPQRVVARPKEEPESYPEVGDRVTHFHFGECEVIDSDGDRIRLRQEKDGRVREVSLTMLKIDPPTTDAAGKKHYELRRKN